MKIFVGWDSRYPEASEVCKASIGSDHELIDLKRDEVRGFKRREPGESTEFAFSRFLVPYLCDYSGYAVFCDNDFLFLEDINEMLDGIDKSKAVSVVKHKYHPKTTHKMGGIPQKDYPRKNWSSLIIWNCGHPMNATLSVDFVNHTRASMLHQFSWLNDYDIGSIPFEWNYLTDWYVTSKPKALHYTTGGPWIPGCEKTKYAEEWYRVRDSL